MAENMARARTDTHMGNQDIVLDELLQAAAWMRKSAETKRAIMVDGYVKPVAKPSPAAEKADIADYEQKVNQLHGLLEVARYEQHRYRAMMAARTREEQARIIRPAWQEGCMISRAVHIVVDSGLEWHRDDAYFDNVLPWEVPDAPWMRR